MILGPLITENPFDLADLHWREARFRPDPATFLTHTTDPLGPVTAHLPDELLPAAPKRRAEFLAGRICALLALREAGLPEIVGIKNRAPIWPQGAAGSISHTDSRVVAVVSRGLKGVGVDCETLMTRSQADDLHSTILTQAETTFRPTGLPHETFLTLAFSAKEALYKALSPRLDRILDFHEVTLTGCTHDRLHLSHAGRTHAALFRLDGTDCLTLVSLTE